MGDTNHVLPKIAYLHVEQHHGCLMHEDFWAGMFADLDWIWWWLPVWEADNRSSTAAAGGEHYPECMHVRFFSACGLFMWLAIVAD